MMYKYHALSQCPVQSQCTFRPKETVTPSNSLTGQGDSKKGQRKPSMLFSFDGVFKVKKISQRSSAVTSLQIGDTIQLALNMWLFPQPRIYGWACPCQHESRYNIILWIEILWSCKAVGGNPRILCNSGTSWLFSEQQTDRHVISLKDEMPKS